jgi:5-hydroxyisourate hydrolase
MAHTGGYVTTHVLDTARGVPAAGIQVDAYLVAEDGEPGARTLVGSATTNADGRTDVPIIAADAIAEAEFELVFHAAAYLGQFATSRGVPFLATIPIRFGVSDASQHYHVPLLLSPFGYATYRGS